MAISESIRVALDGVLFASAEIDSLLRSFESLERSDLHDSPMVYVFRAQFDRYTKSCDELEIILRQQVLPVIEDFETVTSSKST